MSIFSYYSYRDALVRVSHVHVQSRQHHHFFITKVIKLSKFHDAYGLK